MHYKLTQKSMTSESIKRAAYALAIAAFALALPAVASATGDAGTCVLELTKTVNATTASQGDVLTYTINYKNKGTGMCTGSGVQLEDDYDQSKLQFLSETHSDEIDPGYVGIPLNDGSKLTWNLYEVSPGQTGWVSWTARVKTTLTCGNYDINNSARATADEIKPVWVSSNSVKTTVTKPCAELAVSCVANPSTVDTGETVTYTANPTGGNGTYTYSWTGTDGLTGSSKTVSKSYSSAGSKSATVTVTSNGVTKTATCGTTVETPTVDLAGSCVGTPSSVSINQNVTWTANPTGGNGTYAYTWTGTDSLQGNGKTLVRNYLTGGTKTATVTITSNGQTITRNCTITVSEPEAELGGTCTATPSQVRVGEQVTFKAQGTGGNGTYNYTWNNASGAIFFPVDWTTFTTVFDTPGTKNLSVKITSNGQSVTKQCTVQVVEQNDLTGSCSVNRSSAKTGDSIVWSADASGGNGSYTYEWSGTHGLSGTSRTVSTWYTVEGTMSGTVRIRSGNQSVTKTCSVRIDDDSDDEDLDVSCKASPRTAKVGERVTWEADVDGGNAPYDYDWDGDDRLRGDDDEITHRYDREGTYDAEVTVTDDDGNKETATCKVRVEEDDDDDDDDDNVAVYTNTDNTNLSSGVYLSQVPYTGLSDSLKLSLYVLAFLLWSGAVSYFILKRKYGTSPMALAAAKAGEMSDELRMRLDNLRMTRRRQDDREDMLKKLWDRVNDE